jgi:hypothetical protein
VCPRHLRPSPQSILAPPCLRRSLPASVSSVSLLLLGRDSLIDLGLTNRRTEGFFFFFSRLIQVFQQTWALIN